MQVEQEEEESMSLRLTRVEIGILVACMNEACNGLDIDFPTRTGYSREEARLLMDQLSPFSL